MAISRKFMTRLAAFVAGCTAVCGSLSLFLAEPASHILLWRGEVPDWLSCWTRALLWILVNSDTARRRLAGERERATSRWPSRLL